MPLTFRQIASNTASVIVQTELGPVTIDYYPNKLTDKLIADLGTGAASNNKLLEGIIKSWDIIDDSVDPPVMFPIDRLPELGIFFKDDVARAIMQHMRPEVVAPQA